MDSSLRNFILMLGDNSLILGQRLGEWCGHGPNLELDIALTNISLDLIGQTRLWYQIIEKYDSFIDEDQLAFLRTVREYRNLLLVEQPNVDFAYTVARQFLYDQYNYQILSSLKECSFSEIAEVAKTAFREVSYHRKWSSEWFIRLGDGTSESQGKLQTACNDLWAYFPEAFEYTEFEKELVHEGLLTSGETLKKNAEKEIEEVLQKATINAPKSSWGHKGGKTGHHSEHLGHILSELQYMQRAYPDSIW